MELSPTVAALAGPADRRVAVRVTADAVRQLRGGHPWLFDSSITTTSHHGAAGDLAVVFDSRRRFVAIGLYDPTSPIRVRVLHHRDPVAIDDAFWARRLERALARRAPLAGSDLTTGWRAVHGENDGLGGLVVDRYDTTLVVKLYTAAWFPHLRPVLAVAAARLGAERVVLRLGRSVVAAPGLADGTTIAGDPPTGPVPFRENGLAMQADVVHGQKTGHFLDQRDNRQRLRGLCAGAHVLDVFSCTGGFTVHAAAGGARSVHSVDRSGDALGLTAGNLARNADLEHVRRCRHHATAGDAFEVLDTLVARGDRYDVVVLDPPSFATRSQQVPQALRAYGRLTDRGLALLRPGGLLLQASCSSRVTEADFHAVVRSRATAAGVALDEVARTTHPLDHPIGFPQGAYLKALFARRR